MAKQKHALQTPPQNSQGTMTYQHQRGVIKENAIQALLHDKLFRQRVERNKKGKGSYQRQAKHANRYYEKPDNKISMIRDFIIGLFSIDINEVIMTVKTEVLFNNTWNVRISDPGEEGAKSHFFETIYITLEAHIDGDDVQYEFTRKVEDQIKIKKVFTELDELFIYLSEQISPLALGHLGIKIGNLGLAKE